MKSLWDRLGPNIITSRKFNVSQSVPAPSFIFPKVGNVDRNVLGFVVAPARNEKSIGEYTRYHKGKCGAELVERDLVQQVRIDTSRDYVSLPYSRTK